MTRTTKLTILGIGLGFLVLACNLTASGLTSQAGQTVSNVAFAQAMSEQAQANQQLAKAVQSVTHTMNLLLIVVLLLAILGAGLYVWKIQLQVQKAPPAALAAPETPLRVVYMPRTQLPEWWDETELLERHSADLFQALTSGEEWQ